MLFVIIICVVLLYVVNKYMKNEPVWMLWLCNIGLILGIVVAVMKMAGLLQA